MEFADVEIPYPYACDPSDQKKTCKLKFEIYGEEDQKYMEKAGTQRGFVQNQCKCALDGFKDPETGAQHGYCSSLLGTEHYRQAMNALAIVLGESQCHTQDRENIRAHRDRKCGIGSYSDQWRFAVDKMFNATHWPYTQNVTTYKCVRQFFADSYDALMLDGKAVSGLNTAGGLLSALALTIYSLS